jgi:hypothetical protein
MRENGTERTAELTTASTLVSMACQVTVSEITAQRTLTMCMGAAIDKCDVTQVVERVLFDVVKYGECATEVIHCMLQILGGRRRQPSSTINEFPRVSAVFSACCLQSDCESGTFGSISICRVDCILNSEGTSLKNTPKVRQTVEFTKYIH